ncbi:hypothetical protein BmHG_00410 [Borrelia miyamotoi]|uniref:Uncharacterized protein n=1 Tax=Borrelia miyamotoi TaxID=47466 RepID=A0AAQ3CLS4_9SPIR|nr:hypothetical protein [Borrelia miyamotoi]AHH05007.1 Pts system, mannose-specific iiabc component [Borrelia miyamotoi FR64b]WAZ70484.1 hypothetical protein O5403_02305 [Borrelia miyamotoi]WCB90991.1 hypothetical protein CNO11_07075 [Borrelia miyamotoi]WCL22124.1 hypothetical protein CNO10_07130 [Borrelia miyamotoi]WDE70353.1 hypothetical protein CNO12_07150 [Borrelia miyamotoi]
MSGVSPIVPIVASGGILIALGISFSGVGADGLNFDKYPFYKKIIDIGAVSFSMIVANTFGFYCYSNC